MLVPLRLPRSVIIAVPQLGITEAKLLKRFMHLVVLVRAGQAEVISHLSFDCLPPSLATVVGAAGPVANPPLS